MSSSELMTLLLFCTAMSFSPGPNTTLSTALAANRRAEARLALLPGRAGRLDAADGRVAASAWARWCWACRRCAGRVKVAGVAYMLWLAWRLAQAPASWRQVDARRLRRQLLAGRRPAVRQHQGLDARADAHRRLGGERRRRAGAQPRAAARHHLRGDGGVRLHQQLRPMPWSARCCAAGWRRAGACSGSTARWRWCWSPRRAGW